jgi:hypothetical protein
LLAVEDGGMKWGMEWGVGRYGMVEGGTWMHHGIGSSRTCWIWIKVANTPMMRHEATSMISIQRLSWTAGQWYLWTRSMTRRSYTSEPLVTVDAIAMVYRGDGSWSRGLAWMRTLARRSSTFGCGFGFGSGAGSCPGGPVRAVVDRREGRGRLMDLPDAIECLKAVTT